MPRQRTNKSTNPARYVPDPSSKSRGYIDLTTGQKVSRRKAEELTQKQNKAKHLGKPEGYTGRINQDEFSRISGKTKKEVKADYKRLGIKSVIIQKDGLITANTKFGKKVWVKYTWPDSRTKTQWQKEQSIIDYRYLLEQGEDEDVSPTYLVQEGVVFTYEWRLSYE